MNPGTGNTKIATAKRALSARILFVIGDRVLLANRRGQDWYYLPGGNVEPGESVEAALLRKLREETGLTPRSLDFVGTVEHVYVAGGKSWHEVNVVFAASVPHFAEIGSHVDDVDISAVATVELGALEFRPPGLGGVIQDWLATRRPRHTSAI
jgi:8-oxo-dGTP pyrophosphatase MutT (NUDIX family)